MHSISVEGGADSPSWEGGTMLIGTRSNISRVVSPAPLVKNTPRAPAAPTTLILTLICSFEGTSPSQHSRNELSAKVFTNFCTTRGSCGIRPASSSMGGGGANVCNTIKLAFCTDNAARKAARACTDVAAL